ncbi:DNA cytosine methyltransferase [Listeria seeligeri]|uniref:DNA cytosine methyltransferase n=1 Tax=Listeria seeligeri TaxID=1640 RepID=UPI00406835E8
MTATDYKQPKQIVVLAGKLPGSHEQNSRVYDTEGVSPTLTTMQGGGQEPKIKVKEATKKGFADAFPGDSINISHPDSETRRGRVGKQLANKLLTGEEQAVVENDFRIRKLTPRECWRLQGFPDWAFDRAAEVNSNSQLYKQAGNSVTVNVIEAIANRLD